MSFTRRKIYDTWILGGPTGTAYNRCPSGWFTADLFEDWFNNVIMPYFRRLPGPKILIGDNLCSHVSFRVIKKCIDEDIRFVLFVPNSTHLCQPLDVGVFRAIKSKWRGVLKKWKLKHRGIMQKHEFPALLKMALDNTVNMKQNIISSFRATGIHPWDPEEVLKRLPREETEADIAANMLNPLVKFLKKYRFPEPDKAKRGRKRKITTPAGRAVTLNDFSDNHSDSDSNLEEGEVREDSNSSSGEDGNEEERESNSCSGEESGNDSDQDDIDQDDIIPNVDEYFAVKFHTEHENHCKIYIGKVQEVDGNEIKLKFLRRRGNFFVFPPIDDIDTVDKTALLKKMTVFLNRRDRFTFLEPVDGIL